MKSSMVYSAGLYKFQLFKVYSHISKDFGHISNKKCHILGIYILEYSPGMH